MAFGFGLARVDESSLSWKGLLEDGYQLWREGNFWNEKNDRLILRNGFSGKGEVNVGLAGTSDAMKKSGCGRCGSEIGKGATLSGIEWNSGR